MQFLKTLFWVVLAVILVLFASVNWAAVTLRLWGGLEADVKLPVLLFAAFLLGFIPTLILYRARIWSLQRRLDAVERQAAGLAWVTAPAPTLPAESVPAATSPPADVTDAPGEQRKATDDPAPPAA